MLAAITSLRVSSHSYLLCFSLLVASVLSEELHILLNLKATLQSSDTNVFDSWNSTNPVCSFHGITCNFNRSVIEIELSNQRISEVLPFDSICQLRSLEKLSFGFNFLHGNISEDLKNCLNLRYLDLGNNIFSGPFPDISPLNQL